MPGTRSSTGTGRAVAAAAALLMTGCCLLLAWSLLPGPARAAGRTVSSTELIEHPDKYNGRRVAYEGEAIGEILRRGDNAWLTLNDDPYRHRPRREYQELKGGNSGIGVYGPYAEASRITRLGSYDSLGDLVLVEGTFFKANPEQGGDLMIEFDTLTVLRKGHAVNRNHIGAKPVVAAALLLASAALAWMWWRSRKRLVG